MHLPSFYNYTNKAPHQYFAKFLYFFPVINLILPFPVILLCNLCAPGISNPGLGGVQRGDEYDRRAAANDRALARRLASPLASTLASTLASCAAPDARQRKRLWRTKVHFI